MSESIERLLILAREAGLKADEGQWSEAFVHWHGSPMPSSVRAAGNSNPMVEYHKVQGSPHLPSHEGFIDRVNRVAITFEVGS